MAENPPEELQTPTLTQLIQLAIENRLQDVHTVSWGTVTAYNASAQEVNVQIIPRRAYIDEDGDRQTERPAPLLGVPVVFPFSGSSGVTYRITAGDVVLLVFAETPADTWQAGGQNDVDAGDDVRRHSLTDAWAIPGLRPRGKRISPAPPTNAAMIADPDTVLLGSTTASAGVITTKDFVNGLNSKLANILADQNAVTALTTYQTAITGGVSPVIAAAKAAYLAALITAINAQSFGSAKVKADA